MEIRLKCQSLPLQIVTSHNYLSQYMMIITTNCSHYDVTENKIKNHKLQEKYSEISIQ